MADNDNKNNSGSSLDRYLNKQASAQAPETPPPNSPPPPPANSSMPDLNIKSAGGATAFVAAGFWIRFVAILVDGVITSLLFFPLTLVTLLPTTIMPRAGGVFALFSIVLKLALVGIYSGWFYNRMGATPGKMIFKLKVLDADSGTYISFWRGFLRDTVGKAISGIILSIGYLMAGFRADHRALHDLMYSTRVVRSRD